MKEVRPKGGMVIKKVGQRLCGCDGADEYRHEQRERTRRTDPESFSASLVELRTDESIPFQCSSPWTGV